MTKLIRVVLVAIAFTLVLANPVDASRHQDDHTVPIKARVSGSDGIDPTAPGCPEGTSWRYSTAGTGQVSHLGRVEYSLSHCTVIDFATGTGTFDHGSIVFVAANGDQLRLAHEGTFVVSPDFLASSIDFTHWDVVGGTGRFEGATGSGTGTGSNDVTIATAWINLRGRIAYDASAG